MRRGSSLELFRDRIIEEMGASLMPGRVQVTMAPLAELPADDPFWQWMRVIWEGQKARGLVPRTGEEVEAERRQVREEWQERRKRCQGSFKVLKGS